VDQGGTSEGLRYVLARFARNPRGEAPATIGIDVFFGGGTPPFRTLAREGLLIPEPIPFPPGLPASLGGIRLQAPEEGWYGTALSSFGILYNRLLLARHSLPEPRRWADLARPEALGWVACVDPRGSGSAHVIYEIVLQKYGWERGFSLLARMAANAKTFTRGASGVLPAIASGEAAFAVAIDQYAWSLIGSDGSDRIGFALPEGETVITPDPAGILKGAPHPEVARRFLEFLLSLEAQRLWLLKPGVPGGPARLPLNRLAVLPAAYAKLDSAVSAVGGDPFADSALAGAGASAWAYSDSLTESRWALLNDLLGLWLVDSHDAALRHWSALAARRPGPSPADTAAWEAEVAKSPWFRPPSGWKEMEPMAARWQEPDFRNATMARWARELAAGGTSP
jgi:ABC-type Fe3+ transport system substrate-binding protein